MRKVILSTNVTLDGYMAGPGGELDWHTNHWNNEMGEYSFQQLRAMDTILLGRNTYQGMAKYWPAAALKNPHANKGDQEFARMMNDYQKIVFSTTLSKAGWQNSRIIKSNITNEIMQLKAQAGKDMIMWGGIGIISTFMQLGLIDEYRIWIAPVVIGKGMKPSIGTNQTLNLELVNTTTFSNGVVLLSYEPAARCGLSFLRTPLVNQL